MKKKWMSCLVLMILIVLNFVSERVNAETEEAIFLGGHYKKGQVIYESASEKMKIYSLEFFVVGVIVFIIIWFFRIMHKFGKQKLTQID